MQRQQPPKWALRFLKGYCAEPLFEEVAGDLEERFLDHCEQFGLKKARRKYWLNVMKFFRWHTLKPRRSNRYSQNNISMFKNYFKIAWRSALRHKAYSFINLSGLAVGLTSFILILLYVQHQNSFDQFHEKKDRIFRVHNGVNAITANIVAPYIKRNFEAEVNLTTRMLFMGSRFFKVDDASFAEGVVFTDPDFFNIFTFPLISGDPETVLKAPNGMVVSQKMALKHFGSTDILGKDFELDGTAYQVAGVMADFPENSVIQFDFAAPLSDIAWARQETWSNITYYSYVLLNEGVDAEQLASKIAQAVNGTFGIPPGSQEESKVILQPIEDIYLQKEGKLDYEPVSMGDITYVYIFSAIAALILLIACVNYVNLSTARSLERAREVGVRKVVGAYRNQLIIQFLSESFLFVFGALLISYALAQLLLPYFANLSGVTIDRLIFQDPGFLLTLAGLGLGLSLLAGFYPAVMLSMFKPVTVLKGSFKTSGKGSGLRKALVVFQFAISAFLLVATLVVNKQLNFIQDKTLGYDREHVLYFVSDPELRQSAEAFKASLLQNPQIKGVTFASQLPVSVPSAHSLQTGERDEDWELIYFMYADEDMMDVTGMKLLAGRDLRERAVPFIPGDTTGLVPSYIVNEATARLFNWTPEEAIGKILDLGGIKAPIQGIVEDFHFKSLQQKIEPFVIMDSPENYYYSMVKVDGRDLAATIDLIKRTTAEFSPALPFDYSFLDERFDRMYHFEMQLAQVFLTFASIAMVIACLGMFGLISFMALNRAKEFGIRKVLGASVSAIVVLMSRDFLKLVFIALLIAVPLAYYFMSGWLNDYVYRTAIGVDVGTLAVLFAVIITVLTIGYQALRAALVNPARSLRNE